MHLFGLNGSQGDGEDDVFNQCAAGQVVNRFAQTLQQRAYAQDVGAALYGFVSTVAGIEVWENQNGCLTGNSAARSFGLADRWNGSRIVLQRDLDGQVRAFFVRQFGCFDYCIDIRAAA